MTFAVQWDIIARDKFSKIADSIKNNAAKMSKSFQDLGQKVEDVNKKFAKSKEALDKLGKMGKDFEYKFGLPVKAAFTGAVYAAKNYQDAISDAQIYTGISYKEIDRAVKEISRTTGAAQNKVAVAFSYWATATDDVTVATKAMRDALMLSKITQEDVGTESDRIAKVIANMGLAIKDTTRVAQGLAAFKQYGMKDIGDYIGAIQALGPAARQVGVDFEDMLGIFGGLEKAGITSSRSIMGMRQILHSLSNISEDTAEQFKKVGIDVTGEVSFPDLMREINEKVLSRSDINFDRFFEKTFGEGTRIIVQDLIKNLDAVTAASEHFRKKSAAVAEEMVEIRDNQLSTALGKLRDSFAKLGEAIISEDVLNAITTGVLWLAKKINSLAESIGPVTRFIILLVGGIVMLLGPVFLLGKKIGLLVLGMAKAFFVTKPLVAVFGFLWKAVKLVAMAFSFLLRFTPVGMIITATTAVIGLLHYFGLLGPMLRWVGAQFKDVFDSIVRGIKWAYDQLMKVINFFRKSKGEMVDEVDMEITHMSKTYTEAKNMNFNHSESDININIAAPEGVVKSVKSRGDENVHVNLTKNILAGTRYSPESMD